MHKHKIDLSSLYTEILATAGMSVDKEGLVSLQLGSETIGPATIKGKRLLLPTQKHLMNLDATTQIAFHPFSENVTRGPSETLEKLLTGFKTRINFTVGLVMHELLRLAASPAEHAKLNPSQSEFLSGVHQADEKTLASFKKILEASTGENSLVHIFLRRSPVLKGKKYARGGVVRFPMIAELEKDSIFGVKVRVKDREVYKNLFTYIFPDCTNQDEYSFGTNSDVAPFIMALLGAMNAVGAPVNEVINRFSNVIEDADDLLIPFDWTDAVKDTDAVLKAVRTIPMQSGNEGDYSNVAGSTPVATNPIAPAVTSSNPVTAILNAPRAPAVQQFVPPRNQFVSGQQLPFAPTQAPVAPSAGVVRTARGVVFDSMINSSPQLAAQAHINQPMQRPNMGMNIPRTPGWAQANSGYFPPAPAPVQGGYPNQFGQQQQQYPFGVPQNNGPYNSI